MKRLTWWSMYGLSGAMERVLWALRGDAQGQDAKVQSPICGQNPWQDHSLDDCVSHWVSLDPRSIQRWVDSGTRTVNCAPIPFLDSSSTLSRMHTLSTCPTLTRECSHGTRLAYMPSKLLSTCMPIRLTTHWIISLPQVCNCSLW